MKRVISSSLGVRVSGFESPQDVQGTPFDDAEREKNRQLDAAAVFYLRSRGIGEAAARAMLTQAFAADLAERIRIPALRAEVERELGERLSGAAGEAAR